MKENLNVFPIEKSMGFIIHLMDRELALGLQKRFRAHEIDITPQHWSVLSKLWETDGLHQSMLAKQSHKDRHNMTRIISLLEKNGYIYRKPDEKDKRLLLVFLTDNGKAMQKKLTSIVLEYLAFAFKGLSIEQLNEMHRVHLHILANLGYRV